MAQVTIGICSGGTIRAETVASLVSGMINIAQKGLAPNLLIQVGGYVDLNRNKIAQKAIAAGSTHLMFIDADMIFPEDGIYRLLEHDKDIVGANYNVRLDPTSATLSGPTVKMLVRGKPVSLVPGGLPDGLFKCYALPTGFMLIKLACLKKLKFPYFEALIDKKGKHTTEDVEFCRRANEAGIEIYCDPTIEMGHIGQYTY
jgi:hypothetical protein